MPRITGDGFEITVRGRAGLCYTENGKTAFIDGELLLGESDFVLYKARAFWEHNGSALSASENERIVENIREAFRKEGLVLEVE